ncbi:UbiA family prenyltransferase [Neiella sp. HB171785]|uniref:UbiA family prenyltransferase n=1 Tax=Neiella litorisoli TaxID=2771431 RepID=A0A8J6QIE6_9GAMM|nr:UbiA family prenyltransferase [Neiella litorisoli]MBD1390575.1 UbiA family prenyltransferase [Neiella litorisoli]
MDKVPLYVDLDGTFIKSDMLLESFWEALKVNPLVLFLAFLWLLKGKSHLKHQLSQYSQPDVGLIPLNPEFHDFLQAESGSRELVLATASNESIAELFVQRYPLFSRHLSSSADRNLKGKNKLAAIKQEQPNFAYAGNSSEDFELFAEAQESYLVNPTSSARKLASGTTFNGRFDEQRASLLVWLKQLRVHQWLKNVLIFVPLFVSWHLTTIDALWATVGAFLSFSLLASSTYIFNDLVDLPADRQHQRKRNRPLASCAISITQGIMVAAVLLVVSLVLSWLVSPAFTGVLLLYLIMTLAYSFKLKRFFGIDVIMLASLYSIRIFAGAVAIGAVVSFWLLSFSMFVFLSLALVKRCAELKALELENKDAVSGRDYNYSDYPVFLGFGTSSATLSILMFSFYANNNVLTNQYQEPELLWLAIPMLGYWLLRMWVKTHRGEMHDDPIVFSIKDRGSVISVMATCVVVLAAQII